MEIELLCLEMLMLLARVTSALPTDAEHYYTDDTGRLCRRCPPGQYQANCGECSACQPEFFTYEWNIEASCLPCHRDCRKEFNLRVVKTCSAVSDVLCSCIDGYTCKDYDGTMKQCKYCLMDTPPTLPPALTKTQTETLCAPGTFLNVSSGNCDLQVISESPTDTPRHMPDTGDRQLWWPVGFIVFLVISLITLATIFIWRRREGTCLKRLFKLCSNGGHKGENDVTAHQPGLAAGQLDANSLTNRNIENHTGLPISIDQGQKATGNLGPFHIYSAGAVFVSLLNHFANPEGETEGGKRPEKEETPSPPSPPIHLSEEERDREKDCIFFPLQEQGKESHLSKEEEMYC